jgi:hypothetical protein
MKVMPWVTSGMTMSALSRYPRNSGMPRHISNASDMIAASMAKNRKVKEA